MCDRSGPSTDETDVTDVTDDEAAAESSAVMGKVREVVTSKKIVGLHMTPLLAVRLSFS